MKKQFLIWATTLLLYFTAQAQIAPTTPPGWGTYKPNFWEYKNTFERFWYNKTPQKGQGYSVFKRWEDYTFRRMNPDGIMPDATVAMWEAINKNAVSHHAEKEMQESCTTGAVWTELGPRWTCSDTRNNGNGRVNFVRFYPETGTPQKMFVGSPGGGVWWRDLSAPSLVWQPLTDYNLTANNGTVDISVLGASDLLIKPGSPNTMYVATGDKDRVGHLNPYTIGVLKTTDGGVTWSLMEGMTVLGGPPTTTVAPMVLKIYKLLMNPTNSNQLFAATDKGIYKTENADNANPTWQPWQSGTTVFDIEFKPNDPNVLYAAGVDRITRYTYSSSSTSWSSAIFNIVSPAGITSKRTELAVVPNSTGATANKLYAIVAGDPNNLTEAPGLYGVYGTSNATATPLNLTKIYGNAGQHNLLSRDYNDPYSTGSGQGDYDLAIVADPADALGNTIYIGGINLYRLRVDVATGIVPQSNVKLISYWQAGGDPTEDHTANAASNPAGYYGHLPSETYINTGSTLTSASPTFRRVNLGATGGMGACTADASNLCKYVYHTFYAPATSLTITSANPNTFLSLYYTPPPSSGTWTTPCSTIFQAGTAASPHTLALTGLSSGSQYSILVSTLNSTVPVPQDYELTFSQAVEGKNSTFPSCYPPIGGYVHADIHALSIANGKLYAGSDGGMYEATIPTGTGYPNDYFVWKDLSKGLGIAQYYGMGNLGGLVVAGAQDNGVAKIDNAALKRWSLINGGDGIECIIDPNSSNQIIYATVNGAVQRSTNGGTTFTTLIKGTTPSSDVSASLLSVGTTTEPENGNFIDRAMALYAPGGGTTAKLYVGFQSVYRVNNPSGASPTSTLITPATSIGDGPVDIIRLSADGNTMFVVKYLNVYKGTRNTSADTWTWVQVLPPSPWAYGQITDIAIKNSTTFYLTQSNYEKKKRVFKVVQSGSTYTATDISFDLPSLPVNTIVYDFDAGSVDRLYVGTDVGVYYTQNCTGSSPKQQWIRFKGATNATNLPNVTVSELEIAQVGTAKILRAATYGRGVWETPIGTVDASCPCACTNGDPTLQDTDGNLTIAKCVNELTSNGYQICLGNSAVTDPDGDLMIISAQSATLPIVASSSSNVCSSGTCSNLCITLDLNSTTIQHYLGLHQIVLTVNDEPSGNSCDVHIKSLTYTVAIVCGASNEFGITCSNCATNTCDYTLYTENARIGCNGLVYSLGYVKANPATVACSASVFKIKLASLPNTTAPEDELRLNPGTHNLRVYRNGLFYNTATVTIGSTQLNNSDININIITTNVQGIWPSGTLCANTTGGAGTFYYTWLRLPNTPIWYDSPVLTNLPVPACGIPPAHQYAVTVTDGAFCSKTATVTMPAYCPPPPTKLDLEQPTEPIGLEAAPNPFSDDIAISYYVLSDEQTTIANCQITLYTTTGVAVAVLHQGDVIANAWQTLYYKNPDLPAGIYWLKMIAGGNIKTIKIVKT